MAAAKNPRCVVNSTAAAVLFINFAACSHLCAVVVPPRQGESAPDFMGITSVKVTRLQYLRASCIQMLLVSLMIEYRSGA